jgi:hypothetical protein
MKRTEYSDHPPNPAKGLRCLAVAMTEEEEEQSCFAKARPECCRASPIWQTRISHPTLIGNNRVSAESVVVCSILGTGMLAM